MEEHDHGGVRDVKRVEQCVSLDMEVVDADQAWRSAGDGRPAMMVEDETKALLRHVEANGSPSRASSRKKMQDG